MTIFNALTLMGGLALFLYGMDVMGNSLVTLSGGKLERILEKLTEKRFMAVLLGAAVTAVIQSSSATTVMVVGFVNSGLMQLTQAVGVIMGANIGTTVTSWILSLTGIEGDNIFVKLLKPSSFSPVLAAVGIVLNMIGKEGSREKNVGNIMLGFAVLMFGMETMSSSVAPLKESESFISILTKFSNPILGMLAGAVLTAVIQSSSASVGILQALCVTGGVNYGMAIPIIMGQNIGTCVTALISSIGASRNAKRAAFIHLYFNLIGTILFMIVFYGLNSLVSFSFLEKSIGPVNIAIIHSLFNIGCTIVLFPFANYLVKLANVTIRRSPDEGPLEKHENSTITALDERFLDTPAIAIQLCKNAANEMADITRRTINLAMETMMTNSSLKAKEVIRLEEETDKFEDVLGTYLLKVSRRDLSTEDSKTLSIVLHSIKDFERIADHSINIVEAVDELQKNNIILSDECKSELNVLSIAIHDIINKTVKAFENDDKGLAGNIEPLEEVVDNLTQELRQRHISRLRNGEYSFETGIVLEDLLINFERVSDHCSNIALSQIHIMDDNYDTHEYLNEKVKGTDPRFIEEYTKQQKIYVLP